MKKRIALLLIVELIINASVMSATATIDRKSTVKLSLSSSASAAFEYLDTAMDQFNKVFNVYSDSNSGGNHYIPSGLMGDWQDLNFDADNTETVKSGLTSIKIDYAANGAQGNDWAGAYWQQPENNWGDLPGGFDLRGSTKATFWARGKQGGEWIDFKVGGINRDPSHDPGKAYQDNFGPIGTGFVQLSSGWQQYTIPLDKDYFDVYRDQHATYVPSGWMGDYGDITFTDTYTVEPYAGRTAIKINYSAQASQGRGWAGIYWQHPENNWGDQDGGFNLTGFEKLKFYAKGEKGGERVEFFAFGLGRDPASGTPIKPYYDSSNKISLGYKTLTNEWQEYTFDLSGKDLSKVIGAFGWVTKQAYNPAGATFYLDDIRFERPMRDDDLSRVIGGFAIATNKDSNPSGATFYLDDIQYDKARPDALRLLNSYEIVSTSETALANTAFTYDNALAMLAYMASGKTNDWQRAKIIGDSLIYAQNHDRDYSDGRLRNAYRSGDITESAGGAALLPGWWDDVQKKWFEDGEAISSSTGNIAWAMIALLAYYEKRGDQEYLDAATKMGEWVDQNVRDTTNTIGGYMGGYHGWVEDPPIKQTWKSTEHNLDLYIAFSRLYQATGDSRWQESANRAKGFVETMWDSQAGHFWTGTLEDGVTTNTSNIPLDIQPWAILAFPYKAEYRRGLDWAEANTATNCQTHACVNYPGNCPGFAGFDFNNDKDGIWPEGTAQMVTAYQMTGQSDKASLYLDELRRIQISARNNNGKGIVAACHDGVTTGFSWQYFNRLHIGATAWFLFAEQGYNPYWPASIDTIKPTGTISINSGAASTSNAAVTLSLSASDTGSGVEKMQFSNDGASWAGWEAFATTKAWTLTAGDGAKTVYVQFKDKAGNISDPISDGINFSTPAPALTDNVAPTTSLSAPKLSTKVSKTTSFKATWSGTDPSPSSGIASYDVQYKIGRGGTWAAWQTNTTALSANFKAKAGQTVYFRARAKDGAGNVGAFSTEVKTIVPYDNNSLISTRSGFAGTFSKASSNFYMGTVRYSKAKGESITYRFTGDHIALISTKGKGYSKAKIFIDGKYKKTVDAKASSAKYRQALYEAALKAGKHIVKIENLATVGRPRFDVDGLGAGR